MHEQSHSSVQFKIKYKWYPYTAKQNLPTDHILHKTIELHNSIKTLFQEIYVHVSHYKKAQCPVQ